MDITDLQCRTFVDVLLDRRDWCGRGARFVGRSGETTYYPYDEVVARATRVAGTLQRLGLRPGDRVALVLPTSIGFLDAFLGAQLAGGIPAALYPPVRLGRLDEYYERTRSMLAKIGARWLITDRAMRQLIGQAVERVQSLEHVLLVDSLGTSGDWTRPDPDPHSAAFLQFSSGTTVEPKAVVVSHANLLSNLGMIDSFFADISAADADNGAVCWLPLYHDMGLLGNMLAGLYHPATITYLGPEQFVARPARWLQALSTYRAIVSAAPDFAYGLCTAKITDQEMAGVDLSNWQVALNGAEPVDVETMQRFAERFSKWGLRPEAMTPVYGLAEAGLAVTFSDPQAPPLVVEFDHAVLTERGLARPGRGRRLPSVGRPMPGLELEIRDDDDRPVPAGTIGEIVIRGGSVSHGYYDDPELSAATIRRGWLHTGDLGFLHDDNLYISGRAKDLLIIRGRNFAPQEFEHALSGLEGIRPGCCVAVSRAIEGQGEQLVILAERDLRVPRPDGELTSRISERILTRLSVAPHAVHLLAPGTLPRTSSGKLRRSAARQLLVTGRLAPPRPVTLFAVAQAVTRSWLALGRRRLSRLRASGRGAAPTGSSQ